MFNKINNKLVPLKGHYFLWNAGTGPVVPFLSTYAKQLGFSSSTVGVMYTVMPFMGMIAKPLFGAIADRYKCQKIIFLTFILVTAAAFLATFYSPTIEPERKIGFACDNSFTSLHTCVNNITVSDCAVTNLQSQIKENSTVRCDLTCPMSDNHWSTICEHWGVSSYCNNAMWSDRLSFQVDIKMWYTEQIGDCVYLRVSNAIFEDGAEHYPNCHDSAHRIFATCDMRCDSVAINEMVEQPQLDDSEVYGAYQFWLLFLFMIIGWVGQAIVVSVTDAVCFEMLDNKPQRYGVQRCFGALGWGLSTVIAGLLMDSFSNSSSSVKNYTSVFYMACGILLLDFVVSYKLNYTQKKMSTNILRDVGLLLTNFRIVIFMLFCIFIGMCTGLVWNFLFWLIEYLAENQEGCDFMTWIKTLQGLVGAVQCLLGELPLFFLSGWILKRIGHVNAISLILLVIGIRFVLYSVIKNPWWFLPVELTNGVTFGLFYATMASYASAVAPSGTETTVQGLVGAIFEGFGVSIGSLVGGALLDYYDPVVTFRIFGITSLILCLVHAGLHYFMDKVCKEVSVEYAAPMDAITMLEKQMNRR